MVRQETPLAMINPLFMSDTGGLDTANNAPAEEPDAAGAWHGTFEGWFIVSCLTVGHVACTILIFFPSTWFAYYSGSPDSSFLVWTLSSANNHGGGPLPPSSVVFVGLPFDLVHLMSHLRLQRGRASLP